MYLWRLLQKNYNKHTYKYVHKSLCMAGNYFVFIWYQSVKWQTSIFIFSSQLHLNTLLVSIATSQSASPTLHHLCITHQFIQTHMMKHLWHQIKRKLYKMLERKINKLLGWYIKVWMKPCLRNLQIYATSSNKVSMVQNYLKEVDKVKKIRL